LVLKNKKIVIATHVFIPGPSQDLRDYLLDKKTGRVLFIGHPLFYDPKLSGSTVEIYEGGSKKFSKISDIKKEFYLFSYIKHFFLNIFWILKSNYRWDGYFGYDALNALSGILLKKIGKVEKVVYYVIDYNPKRFANPLVNKIFHLADKICVLNCDETWNLSYRMEESRKEYFGVYGGHQKEVQIGIWYDRIKRLPFEEIDKRTLVFSGWLIESKGVQHIISAIPRILEKIPSFKFIVIGKGEYADELKSLAKNLGVEKQVKFLGFVDDQEAVLCKCACAVALYEKYDKGSLTYTYFTDPSKLKTYLACGLPIILTDVTHNAKDIEDKKCGVIIDLDKKSISNAVVKILSSPGKLKEYRENAAKYAKNYDWNKLFEDNLSRVLGI